MRVEIDTERRTLIVDDGGAPRALPLYGREAFEVLSVCWLKVGFAARHVYGFTWHGRPVIQLPEDLVRVQEVVHRLRPDFVVETGIAHGGSLVFYASILEALGHGRVVGVDVDIRRHNRTAIEAHPLFHRIDLVEGSSIDPEVVSRVKALIPPGSTVLVVLDSDHTKAHVAAELEAYHDLVSPGSYLVAADGIMEILHDVPGGKPEWRADNPAAAVREFAARHPEFVIEEPPWAFNEGQLVRNVTYWAGGWLRRSDEVGIGSVALRDRDHR